MAVYKQAILIGRFQPLCVNHVELMKLAARLADELLVVIGCADTELAKKKLTPIELVKYRNSYVLSFERIREALETVKMDLPVHILGIKDILDPPRYGGYVLDTIAGHGIKLGKALLVGENEKTYACFKNLAIDLLIPADISNIHASDVRRELARDGISANLVSKLSDDEINAYIDAQKILDSQIAD